MSGTITTREFDLIRDFIEQETAISLSADKVYLVETRLSEIMRRDNLSDYFALHQALKDPRQQALRDEVIDAMTTNETLWFRDTSPFDAFRDHLLPAYAAEIRAGQRDKIRIWSAASSTGQEAYSLAMIFSEATRTDSALQLDQLDILATDLSDSALAKARSGVYGGIAMDRGLPAEFKKKYFLPKGDAYEISPEIRDRVVFRKFNLQDSFIMMGSFDIILTRYVLIYFQDDFKREVLRKVHGALTEGGILFVGSSESLPDGTPGYTLVRRGRGTWYQKVGADRAPLGAKPVVAPSLNPVAPGTPTSGASAAAADATTAGLRKATEDLTEIVRRLREMNEKHKPEA